MSKPYLQITLDELNSIPEIIFKGEEIKGRREVIFHWETDTDKPGGTTVKVEYLCGNGHCPKTKRIEERTKNHIG